MSDTSANLSQRDIFKAWFPLAASWLLMAAELPLLSAVIARLANPEINLAAFGGIVFPIALIIESPVIMFLAASTALSKDQASYQMIRKIMNRFGVVLSLLHFLCAATPFYYFITRDVLGAPAEIIEPARIGLIILIPWTWAIAYRRFNQGVLIRYGYSHVVGWGTVLRLIADCAVLLCGYLTATYSGVAIGAAAILAGVVVEALYVARCVRPVLRGPLENTKAISPPLSVRDFMGFYIPLAITPLVILLGQPICSAAVSRMPFPLESLAVWPVINGLIFSLRSCGMAYNEVVIALLDKPGGRDALRLFTRNMALLVTAVTLIIALTPLAPFWFETVSGLKPELALLAKMTLWIALLMPAMNVFQSWFQGILVHSHHTRVVTESVFVYLGVTVALLVTGVMVGDYTGVYVGMTSLAIGNLLRQVWLHYRVVQLCEKQDQC